MLPPPSDRVKIHEVERFFLGSFSRYRERVFLTIVLW